MKEREGGTKEVMTGKMATLWGGKYEVVTWLCYFTMQAYVKTSNSTHLKYIEFLICQLSLNKDGKANSPKTQVKEVIYRRINDALEMWCWRRLLRVPWTARRSNQSILKEISPEHALEGLMLKLKLQSFGHLMQRTDSLEKTLMLGKIEGRKRKGWQDEMGGWHHQLNGHEFEQAPGVGDGQGSLVCCSPWGCKESDTTGLLNWTEIPLTWNSRKGKFNLWWQKADQWFPDQWDWG